MRPTARILLAATATAAAAAIAVVPATAASSHRAAAAVLPRCHTSGLAVHLGRIDAGAGQRDERVTLRNTTGHACRTQGWVGMQLRRNGHDVATNVVRIDGPSHRVVLQPGQHARALLHWAAIPVGTETGPQCEPNPLRVRITPPDETAFVVKHWGGGPVCGHGEIDVKPLGHG
jgi:hypothetical protein